MAGKILLKSALRGVLPDEILDRSKMGFGVPLARWFREEFRQLPGDVLLGADTRIHAYIKPTAIAQMIDQHHAESADHSLRLWVLLQLETWHRDVVESKIIEHQASAALAT
jgi:asparagine synthase (glutamine-hydrolysing)